MNKSYYPSPRIGMTVRVCPETYEGLRLAARDLGFSLQDIILGAVLMEYGLSEYSPDALACPVTANLVGEQRKRFRAFARSICPLYRPPEWWSLHLLSGDLPAQLPNLLILSIKIQNEALQHLDKLRDV